VSVDTYLCPGCDKEVRVGSRYCPHCNPPSKRRKRQQSAASGSKRGTARDHSYDGLDLPDDDFDYEDFVAREFGGKPHRKTGLRWYWWLTAVGVLGLMILAGFSFAGWGGFAWW
jgi:hypothetical protein